MSLKVLTKIDRFYYILFFVLILLSILIIFVVNKNFRAFLVSRELDEKIIIPENKLNNADIDRIYEAVFHKNIPPLDLSK